MGNYIKTYVLLSPKKLHDSLFETLSTQIKGNWIRITDKEAFSFKQLNQIKPDKIFIPHWSYIIPEVIYVTWTCIVFHMTDLPFGRGGSPLQNLIIRGFKETKISAIKVNKGIDNGDVYLKKSLSLEGTAYEIFKRANPIIREMIFEIIEFKIKPKPQIGEPLIFARRKPEQSNISSLNTLDEVYNYIRMLDCEGYPNAFVEIGNFRFEFNRASLKENKLIIADVRITKK
jgi:methionyl-tRNA formyltransferase